MCEQGHPNLCHRLHFCGLYPDAGSLSQWMHMPAHTCFPLPDSIDDAGGALLEPLGVAIHATDLAKIQVAEQRGHPRRRLDRPVHAADRARRPARSRSLWWINFRGGWRWRRSWGRSRSTSGEQDPVAAVMEATGGQGVDVAIEAAWADQSIHQAAAMARLGGRLVLVGIPGDDKFQLTHSDGAAQGADDPHVTAHEACLPACDQAGGVGRREPQLRHQPPLPAGAGAGGLCA